MIERKQIILDAEQHKALCCDNYLCIEDVEFEIIEDEYDGTRRHTEDHHIIFKLNNEFYRVEYETSVKDEMGWKDCNWQKEFKAVQVFPRTVEIVIYE